MLAPIATLAFLIILWTAVRVLADLLANSERIAAALRGEERTAAVAVSLRRPIRGRYGSRPPLRARPELRAAA